MVRGKRPVWDEDASYKGSDGKVYMVLESSERTVTIMRVAWMWDKDEHLDATYQNCDTRGRVDISKQLEAKYTQTLERHRAPSQRSKDGVAEYVILADGSKLRSTSRIGPAALKRLTDAAGVRGFRLVRMSFSGPITSPDDALFRKYNEYSPISVEDPGNPKLHAIFGAMSHLLEEKVLSPALVEPLIARIESEYRDFQSPFATSEEIDSWRTRRSTQLLYSVTTKVDKAYWRRAEKYVRGLIKDNAGSRRMKQSE